MTRRAQPSRFKLEDLRDDAASRKRDWRWKFLNTLVTTQSVTKSCLAARTSRDTAYKHRKRFPRFCRRWDEAIDIGIDFLESEVHERALDRADKASHLLLMFKLKSIYPEKYRDVHIPRVAPEDDAEAIDPAAAAAALKAATATQSHGPSQTQGDPQHPAGDGGPSP